MKHYSLSEGMTNPDPLTGLITLFRGDDYVFRFPVFWLSEVTTMFAT